MNEGDIKMTRGVKTKDVTRTFSDRGLKMCTGIMGEGEGGGVC